MLDSICKLLERTNNISRSIYTWNALNAILSALQCPLVLMVITRTNDISDAGIFSIAFAVANLMLYVGLYGLRRFQASDINEQFVFSDYHGMRFITCFIMIGAIIAYCIYGFVFRDYSTDKVLIVFLVCALKVIQAYTDVIHGSMQQKGRLDVATKCSSVRYVLEALSICVVLVICSNLLLACAVSLAVSIIITFLTTINAGRKYIDTYRPSFDRQRLRSLIIEGFPLFLSLFLNMYISNAPKYAIDANLSEDMQAIYNILFMPAFMVMLLSYFIFNPIIKTYAELWLSEKKDEHLILRKKIRRQNILVALLSAVGIAVAATIGIPVLSLIFGVDLTGRMPVLCVVMIGGAALAYATFYTTVITIVREQRKMIICYGIAAILAFGLSTPLVVRYEIMGAAILYAIIMTVLALLLGIILFSSLKKADRSHSS